MTMRTWGRVVPLGVADEAGETNIFMALLNRSEIAGDAQSLEGVFGFMIQRAAGPFRHLGQFEFGQDLVDVGSGGSDREGDVGVAERAVALAVLCQIKRNDRDIFTLGVGPDVGLGPMQDRMNPQMRAWRRRGIELIPKFRRLRADIPPVFDAAR